MAFNRAATVSVKEMCLKNFHHTKNCSAIFFTFISFAFHVNSIEFQQENYFHRGFTYPDGFIQCKKTRAKNCHAWAPLIYFHDRSAYSAAGKCVWTNPGNISIAHRHVNLEIGTEAAQLPEKDYINGIFVAVHYL
jgi:hypothetical protein